MNNHYDDLAARLEAAIEKLERPAVPLADQLWTIAQVATYLHRNAKSVRETMICLPNFPKAIRLPSKGRGRPLYNAAEVVEWARRYREDT
jgi:hypothetical protein